MVSGILLQGHPWSSSQDYPQNERSCGLLNIRNGKPLRPEQESTVMETWNNSPAGPQTVAAKHNLRSALLAGPSLGRAPLCTVLFLLGGKIITFHFKKTSGKQTSEKHVGKMRFPAVREAVSFCILMGKKNDNRNPKPQSLQV